ncbi:MAG: hypothetical protein JNJ57_02250 [Saprospiraceae bacterium]|nr:hypothetical protein [Saprospiraceae bacterium]
MKSFLLFSLAVLFQISCFGQNEKFDQIERYSETLEFIDMHSILYNRSLLDPNPEPTDQFLEFMRTVGIQDIEKCLNSEKAKVRALGLICLYQTDNQKLFLRAADFLTDSALCFKERLKSIPGATVGFGQQMTPEKVHHIASKDLYIADIASSMLQFYFNRAGYFYFEKDLNEFLEERKNLGYTAGFLALLTDKATGGISPFKPSRQPLVDALRNRVEQVENEVDRAIYKLYLSTEEHEIFSHHEKVAALKFLGKKRVSQILMWQPPTNDPDLKNIHKKDLSNFPYVRMCKWILQNAPVLFDKKDAAFFLERDAYERGISKASGTTLWFPYWHIAAARVDKAHASDYIKAGIVLFGDKHHYFERATLYAELWHLKGLKEADFILDWVFNSYVLNAQSKERIDEFISNLDQKQDLVLIKKIIADPRFADSMNVWYVIRLAWQINILRAAEIIPTQLTRNIHHPFGLDRVEWWRDRALTEFPAETKQMLEQTGILIDALKKVQ